MNFKKWYFWLVIRFENIMALYLARKCGVPIIGIPQEKYRKYHLMMFVPLIDKKKPADYMPLLIGLNALNKWIRKSMIDEAMKLELDDLIKEVEQIRREDG